MPSHSDKKLSRLLTPHAIVCCAFLIWAVSAAYRLFSFGGISSRIRGSLAIALLIAAAAVVAGTVYIIATKRRADAGRDIPRSLQTLSLCLCLFFCAATWPGFGTQELHRGNLDKFNVVAGIAILLWISRAWLTTQTAAAIRKLSRALDITGKVGCSLLFFLILSELTVRLLDPVFAARLGGIDVYSNEPNGAQSTARRPGINSLGFKDTEWVTEKPGGVFRIAALGDSFAHSVVTYHENYLTILEDQLTEAAGRSVEILNFGQPGTSPRHYLGVLQKIAMNYEPDLVLVNFFIGNDFNVKAPYAGISVAGHTFPAERRGNWFTDRMYKKNWHLYQLMRMFWLVRTGVESEQLVIAKSDPAEERICDYTRPTFSAKEYSRIQLDRAIIFRKEADFQVLSDRWETTRSWMRQIVDFCRAGKVPVMIAILPSEFQIDPEARRVVLNEYGLNEETFLLDKPNQLLTESFKSWSVPCIDLMPAFAAHIVQLPLYIPRDTHWNPAGNRLAADTILAWPELLQAIQGIDKSVNDEPGN